MVSGMLTAIRDFVQDSFQVGRGRRPRSAEGRRALGLDRAGPARARSPSSSAARHRVAAHHAAARARALHAQIGGSSNAFDGDAARFEGTRRRCDVVSSARVSASAAAGIRRWSWSSRRPCCSRLRRLDGLRAAARQPLERLSRRAPRRSRASSSCPRAGRREVRRHRTARSARAPIRHRCCRPHAHPIEWTADGSCIRRCDPALALARARQLLGPPDGVSARFRMACCSRGSAPVDGWRPRSVAPLVPASRSSIPRPAIDAALPRWRAIEAASPHVRQGEAGARRR